MARLGWPQESGVVSTKLMVKRLTPIVQVSPKNESGKNTAVPPTGDQLNRLTDFIAFLEN